LFVWSNAYNIETSETFNTFPYWAQSPITLEYRKYEKEADLWDEVEAISELAETSKTRTMGQILFDLVPLFASPSFFKEQWMADMLNEYHWIKNFNISPGNLDEIEANRLDCWTIIENEMNQIKKYESEKNRE